MKFIGYFETRENGELVDDWKEWCDMPTKQDATAYFKEICPSDSEVVMVTHG